MATNSFADTHDIYWKRIGNTSPSETVKNTGVIFDPGKKIFKVRIIDEIYDVDPQNRIITCEKILPSKINFEIMVIAVTYLSLGEDKLISGEWVSEKTLPGGAVFFEGVHSLPANEIINEFGNDTERISKRCEALGGMKIEGIKSDIDAEFQLLPKFPVRMMYWKEDEEFPARVCFYFDKYACRYLYLDGILALINIFSKKLTKG